jgi:transcriptional regulator with XRE-family HTH domain
MKDEGMSKLGKFLEEKRKSRGLTQNEVGKLLGFGNGQFISNIERDDGVLPPAHFKKIARLYNVDVYEMMSLAIDDFTELLKKTAGI